MVEDDEYELVSSEEVDRLKREIEHLKSNPFVQNSSDTKLYEAVRSLNESVGKLCVLFENINKQLMREYQSGETPEAKLDKLLEQNRNIAEALVTFVSKNETGNDSQPQQSEPIYPSIQQPNQIQGQVPPNPFVSQERQNTQSMPVFPQNTYAPQSQFNPVQLNQQNQGQKFTFNGRVDPNFPTPDNFPSLSTPPTMGEPINLDVKKKGFLGFGKK